MTAEAILRPVEFHERIIKLQQRMQGQDIAGFLVTQHVDLYYLTGSMQAGMAFIPAAGAAVFYVKRSIERARKESVIPVEPMPSMRVFGTALRERYSSIFGTAAPVKIATEMDVLPAQTFARLAAQLEAAAGHVSLVDGSSLIRQIRMIKSAWEISRIEAAADAVAESLHATVGMLREGMSELELIARIEYEIRIRGHMGMMRTRSYNMEVMTGMLGSGEAAAEPSAFDGPAGGRGLGPAAPQSVSRRAIERNEPILIDVGCCIDGYIIDQTRTAVIGSLPDDMAAAYFHSESLIREAEEMLQPGTSCEVLYDRALKQAADFGLSAHFMGYGADQVRFLGHGIGLEVDEWPVLARGFTAPLETGMVLAVEPKFTFPGRGVVGIENSYLITDKGPRQLTKSPEGLIVLT
ncbi:M24 family metallopeptidase [Paenibacillus nasutitermitis]|uniref:Peptidase M24 n=1 Tax=Paenibacillus nasutitermitis TaxID=1652958 RepID=A0A917E3N2_9BACL|nr:Xaa-Pro peptidase family protein [Paenibacillus nasutitermitis]GGE01769.1 peptidase M24 [Paenibacillus nasutitermitis]